MNSVFCDGGWQPLPFYPLKKNPWILTNTCVSSTHQTGQPDLRVSGCICVLHHWPRRPSGQYEGNKTEYKKTYCKSMLINLVFGWPLPVKLFLCIAVMLWWLMLYHFIHIWCMWIWVCLNIDFSWVHMFSFSLLWNCVFGNHHIHTTQTKDISVKDKHFSV